MKEYRDDVCKVHDKLDRDTQKELYAKMNSGDSEARDRIIFSCLPLVLDMASKFRTNNKHIDLEDLVQEGNIALVNAVDRWDAERCSITTVATWYIRNRLIDMIHDAKYKIKNPLSLSRRASEELSKIKRQNTSDVKEISNKTKITEKRINKLLSVEAKNRFDPKELKGLLEQQQEEDKIHKPCVADLEVLVAKVLKQPEKDIFLRWSGINGKKEGVTKISKDLKLTVKETMSHLSSAKRSLKKQANEERDLLNA
jgi:RNA polymerase sigma factor (sigma-70 family)